MSPLLTTLTTLAGLGCAVLGGVFVAFSIPVIKALGRLPAAQGISAMQAMNRGAVDPSRAEAATQWTGYRRGWTRWNRVRALASLAAATVHIVPLVLR